MTPKRPQLPTDPFRVDGKVCVVTGVCGGIGGATVDALRDGGATVVGFDVAGGDVKVDVTDRAQVVDAVQGVVDEHGRLDAMCNVAGIIRNAFVADIPEADLDLVFAVNLKGVLWGCQAALPHLTAGGAIVNVASAAAYMGAPNNGAYGITKAGVVSMTRTLAAECASAGIRVNAVAPGMVVTPFTLRHGDEDHVRGMASMNPMKEAVEKEDVGATIRYLVSDAARTLTGQVVHPNSGVLMVT